MIRLTRPPIIRFVASAVALVSAAACTSGASGPRPMLPAQLETCGPSLHDSTGPTPRTPQISAIPADSGALVGTVLDAQWGTGMSHVLVRASGRAEEQVMTDSLGGFAFRALRPGDTWCAPCASALTRWRSQPPCGRAAPRRSRYGCS